MTSSSTNFFIELKFSPSSTRLYQSVDTGNLTYFNNLTEQYAFFETLDTLQYHYFVEVTYDCGDGPSCPTINYYNHSPYVGVEEAKAFQLKVFPTLHKTVCLLNQTNR